MSQIAKKRRQIHVHVDVHVIHIQIDWFNLKNRQISDPNMSYIINYMNYYCRDQLQKKMLVRMAYIHCTCSKRKKKKNENKTCKFNIICKDKSFQYEFHIPVHVCTTHTSMPPQSNIQCMCTCPRNVMNLIFCPIHF